MKTPQTGRRVQISPSLLASDFTALGDAVRAVEKGGADLIHVDVMDGHFVPNITIGIPVVRALKRVATKPLDVHLMIEDPDRHLEAFADAGAGTITVHAEAVTHLHRTLAQIRKLGARAGVALNPATPVSAIEEVIGAIDCVLVMTVNPGFGGQAFIAESYDKVRRVRALLDAHGSAANIEVDGGVDAGNAAALVEAGADILVAGASIFGSGDAARATADLRRAAGA
ncbi:MAG TPA: ribulose-phosphate 3-epimerase [Vicinamibacterales bacterium]|nr:ribulose-phosphate 3-epimerase [Vicinamibacterales bacterium]